MIIHINKPDKRCYFKFLVNAKMHELHFCCICLSDSSGRVLLAYFVEEISLGNVKYLEKSDFMLTFFYQHFMIIHFLFQKIGCDRPVNYKKENLKTVLKTEYKVRK